MMVVQTLRTNPETRQEPTTFLPAVVFTTGANAARKFHPRSQALKITIFELQGVDIRIPFPSHSLMNSAAGLNRITKATDTSAGHLTGIENIYPQIGFGYERIRIDDCVVPESIW